METPKPAKKPGRPPKAGVAMSTNQRSKEYRARRKAATRAMQENAGVAHENLKGSNTAVLIAGLWRQIKLMKADAAHAPVARDIAAMIIQEICDRHTIEIPKLSVPADGVVISANKDQPKTATADGSW